MIADIYDYLESRRGPILDALTSLGPGHQEALGLAGRAAESLGRIVEFCSRGKMIRGCLVFLGAQAARPLPPSRRQAVEEMLPRLAAAMELFQAGLLAHDDIMDRDLTRRGAPTVHARYAAEAREAGYKDAEHSGEALGICLGDLCYFEAYGLLSRALADAPRAGEIVALCSSVLADVAVAQMSDVAWGAGSLEPEEGEILAMYRGKTSRYSFCLPLAAGALAADDPEVAGALSDLGEKLGMLFQIRDDELGLFGSPQATGKGVGSDLREGKKTLFRSRILAAAPYSEKKRLRSLFGGEVDPRAEDLDYLRALAEVTGVSEGITAMAREAESKAKAILRGLPSMAPEPRATLEGLIEYVTSREK